MQTIFAFGLATGKHAMGSSDPLGTPIEDQDTHEDETINLDDEEQPSSPGIGASAAAPPRAGTAAYEADKKRRRSVFAEEDVGHMTFITDAVKMVAMAITNVASPDVHPALYSAVMDASPTFSSEAKMVALSHLFDNRA